MHEHGRCIKLVGHQRIESTLSKSQSLADYIKALLVPPPPPPPPEICEIVGLFPRFQSQDASDGGVSLLLSCHPGLHDDCRLMSLSLSLASR